MAEGKSDKVYIRLGFVEEFFLSGFAAVISKTLSAPIERIKMVKQNEDEMIKKGTLDRRFTSIADCARWIQTNEGFVSFWRSNFTNCIRYFPTQALNFAFKGQVKKLEHLKFKADDPYWLKMTKNVISGGLAGGGSLLFVYSLDYARTRLSNDLKAAGSTQEREYTGLIDVYRKTWAAEGMRGLYAGFNISFVGIFVYRGLYFGLYDSVMPLLPKDVNIGVRFAVGYVVTVLAGLASYPIDTIRRRMMMVAGADASMKYNGSLDCARYILKNEGFKSYFKGAGANILRGIAGAGVLSGFDTVQNYYITYRYGPNAVVAN
jgi:solute carrier family 25 (adenine nucleotide translocator) protein 4/5/6/31